MFNRKQYEILKAARAKIEKLQKETAEAVRDREEAAQKLLETHEIETICVNGKNYIAIPENEFTKIAKPFLLWKDIANYSIRNERDNVKDNENITLAKYLASEFAGDTEGIIYAIYTVLHKTP